MRHGKNLLPLPRPGTPPAALVAIGLSVGMWGYAIAGVVLAVAGIFLLLVNAATPGETGRGFVKRLGVRNWTHSPSRQDGGQPRRSQGGAPGSVGRARVAARCRSVTIRKPRTLKLGLAGSGTNNILLACLWGGRITAEVRPLHYQLACLRQGVVSTMRQAGPFYDLITGDDLTWGDRDGPLPWPPSPIRRSDRRFRPPEPSQADALFLFLDRRFTACGGLDADRLGVVARSQRRRRRHPRRGEGGLPAHLARSR